MESLQAFFIQWTENTGTPEFTQEYTIYRLGDGKGFRVMGKITQDMGYVQHAGSGGGPNRRRARV